MSIKIDRKKASKIKQFSYRLFSRGLGGLFFGLKMVEIGLELSQIGWLRSQNGQFGLEIKRIE